MMHHRRHASDQHFHRTVAVSLKPLLTRGGTSRLDTGETHEYRTALCTQAKLIMLKRNSSTINRTVRHKNVGIASCPGQSSPITVSDGLGQRLKI
ncbi:hypothetical protein CHS0354_010215 [Potamilus streckersoni]|uniref:Uncharacterized protein n=1 Tax=Potamilus streckersoni TaxID=2493646 RepID=A0AAE0RSK1_9BIVA|nr:hypothetical protein CHS0354_010215 [Potamilus streckersoni]